MRTKLTPRIRRGGYLFISWIGDHEPRHVHVFRNGELIVKWDLEHLRPMAGNANRKLLRILSELVKEGLL